MGATFMGLGLALGMGKRSVGAEAGRPSVQPTEEL